MNQSRATGVITWGANSIKLQADMGALVLLPALTHFLSKPSALLRSADAKASVQPAGETA
jgi:hypothetical protein